MGPPGTRIVPAVSNSPPAARKRQSTDSLSRPETSTKIVCSPISVEAASGSWSWAELVFCGACALWHIILRMVGGHCLRSSLYLGALFSELIYFIFSHSRNLREDNLSVGNPTLNNYNNNSNSNNNCSTTAHISDRNRTFSVCSTRCHISRS